MQVGVHANLGYDFYTLTHNFRGKRVEQALHIGDIPTTSEFQKLVAHKAMCVGEGEGGMRGANHLVHRFQRQTPAKSVCVGMYNRGGGVEGLAMPGRTMNAGRLRQE